MTSDIRDDSEGTTSPDEPAGDAPTGDDKVAADEGVIAAHGPPPPEPPPAVSAGPVEPLPPPESLPKPPMEQPPTVARVPEEPPPMSVPRPMPFKPPRVVPSAKIVELSPDHGSVLGGLKLTIQGDRLFRESIVRIDGVLAKTIGADEPREVRVTVPPRATPGAVDVSIQNPGSDEVVLAKAFRYEPLPAPKVTSVAPNRGRLRGGTELSVIGEGFVTGTIVLFGTQEISAVKLVDARTIDLKTPPGKHEQWVDVGVRNPDGKQAVMRRAFMYDERYD